MYLGTKSSRRPTWVKCKNSAFQHKPGDSRRLPPAPKNHGQFLLQSSSTTSCAKSCCFVSSRTSWKLTPLCAPNHAVFTGFQERCRWRKLRKTILDFLWKGGNGRNLLQLQSPAQPLGHCIGLFVYLPDTLTVSSCEKRLSSISAFPGHPSL